MHGRPPVVAGVRFWLGYESTRTCPITQIVWPPIIRWQQMNNQKASANQQRYTRHTVTPVTTEFCLFSFLYILICINWHFITPVSHYHHHIMSLPPSLAAFAFLLVSSVKGFSGLTIPLSGTPAARTTAMRRFSSTSTVLDSQWTVQEDITATMMEASFSNESLDKANKMAGNLLPETDLLGNVEGSVLPRQQPSPVNSAEELMEEDKGIRKLKVSASVKETGYDSINSYMVSFGSTLLVLIGDISE